MLYNSNRSKLKAIISGGGTGGHIFPAIAIANTLKKRVPEAEILFIGARDKMEMEKVPAAGYPIEGLWISGLQRKLTWQNLAFPVKVISSLNKAKKIINRFKPDVVIGVGGFASGPTLRAATGVKIPALIQEQNSYPGITNKLLAKRVDRICVAYEGMEKYFPEEKIVLTGNPVRQEVIDIAGKKSEAVEFFGLDTTQKILLVIGGSLGALAVNKGVLANLENFRKNNIQVIWQTGKYFYPTATTETSTMDLTGIRIIAFIDRMDFAYAAADVIISRAGAIAISEICAVAKPTIFVPLPTAAEDHQRKNAQALVDKHAAILIPNHEVQDKLQETVTDLIKNDQQQVEFISNLKKLAIKDASERIVDEILKLIKQA
ncbi:MAG: undecaprenyldiphospho-muramoylpentapeptide beta-N-acetylglucosaminyltransferase [Bacteroidales bacterium]|nr:undecaprenyldiphospho-muramoylpentapeptide beta-N-acetylglucosaminyltransferase [Bacteroidales bacterium]